MPAQWGGGFILFFIPEKDSVDVGVQVCATHTVGNQSGTLSYMHVSVTHFSYLNTDGASVNIYLHLLKYEFHPSRMLNR